MVDTDRRYSDHARQAHAGGLACIRFEERKGPAVGVRGQPDIAHSRRRRGAHSVGNDGIAARTFSFAFSARWKPSSDVECREWGGENCS